MRKILHHALAGIGFICLTGCSALPDASPKPNVLLILVDDLGWADVKALNPQTSYATPNMDRLSREGILFSNGYAASPVCSPTRAALLTGMHPTRLETTDFFRNKSRPNHKYREGRYAPARFRETLPEDVPTIADVLGRNGYDTAFLGKWHLGQTEEFWPKAHGFDVNIGGVAAGSPPGGYFAPYDNPLLDDGPDGEYLTERLTTEAINLIESYATTDDPFFVMMSYYSVHTPLQAPQETVAKYESEFGAVDPAAAYVEIEQVWPVAEPRLSRNEQTHPTYAAMVETVDQNIGRLLERLDSLQLRENTVVVLLSDNGGLSTAEGSPTSNLPLRGGKGWLYEGGIRVPFVLRVPGISGDGAPISAPAISTDIAATLYDLVGIEQDATSPLDGKSLLPLIKTNEKSEDRPLIFHYPHYSNQGGFPGAAIRLGDWKLIERFEDGRLQLFNLAADMGESNDLAMAHPEKAQELQALLHNWYKEHDARFLRASPARPEYGEPWTPVEE